METSEPHANDLLLPLGPSLVVYQLSTPPAGDRVLDFSARSSNPPQDLVLSSSDFGSLDHC